MPLINCKINLILMCWKKNKEEPYQRIIERSKSNDYTAGNLLDYEYFLKHYKLIVIDLSKQIK